MAKQRYINTRFWQDNYISNLDPSEKLLFLYCLTSPSTNISGAYEIPLKIIAADTGYDQDMIKKIFARFEKDNKIIYKDGWLFIVNFIKHQSSKSSKVQIGITENLKDAPEWIKNRVSIPYADPIIYSNSNSNSNLNSNLNSNINDEQNEEEPKNKKEYSPEVMEIASYYWERISRPLSIKDLDEMPYTWLKHIDDIVKTGVALDTIKKVIDFINKDDFWKQAIISTEKLKKQFDKIEFKMRNTPTPEELEKRRKREAEEEINRKYRK